jgi:hypothetical protein
MQVYDSIMATAGNITTVKSLPLQGKYGETGEKPATAKYNQQQQHSPAKQAGNKGNQL